MKNVFIVDGIRTAIGSFRGGLSGVRADDLAALPINYLTEKYDFLNTDTDDVILGCANQAGEDNRNIARMALLLAGMHYSVPGETVNRLCASGMSAVVHAGRAIQAGDGDLFVAGGVEHMTRGPYVVAKPSQAFGSDARMYDSSFGWRFVNTRMEKLYGVEAMGETAENLADKYHISREDQDTFAFQSQMKATKALKNGILAQEIMPVQIPSGKSDVIIFDTDEFIKPHTTMEGLSKLRTAFRKDGTVTAGNASGLNDGAAAMMIASESAVDKYNLNPLTRVVSTAVAGVEPRIMGIGPVEASIKALKKAGLSMNQMDIIEINEAFAVQVLACMKELNLSMDDTRINPNGGAIALGHPLGMSGTRILLSASLELNRNNKRYALVTMCIGVGQGYAVILENCNVQVDK